MGYPDYQSYGQWRGDPLVAGLINVPSATVPLGTFPVTNYAALRVLFDPNINDQFLVLQFSEDAANTVNAGVVQVFGTTLCLSDVIIPCNGAFVSIFIEGSVPHTGTVVVLITPTNVAVNKAVYQVSDCYLATGLVTLAASGANTYTLPRVCPGPIGIFFEPLDTTGKLNVSMAGQSGGPSAGTFIDGMIGPTQVVRMIMQSPDIPIAFNVSNQDGAASHQFRLGAVPAL